MILNTILRLINTQEILGTTPKSDSKLREDLYLNFMDLAELITDIEGEFRISLTGKEIEEISTVADLVELVRFKMRNK